jgi:hypothetical protein
MGGGEDSEEEDVAGSREKDLTIYTFNCSTKRCLMKGVFWSVFKAATAQNRPSIFVPLKRENEERKFPLHLSLIFLLAHLYICYK